ncbi:MAG TPA: ADP-ribosylglycohydrolase family protein [Candidatus Dormibacteraeota bacterium]
MTVAERLAGGVWGHLVGDAMGVPYEFTPPEGIDAVEWGHQGTHRQPPGTWSDDGGLMLALLDSLLECGFDAEDQGRRALRWLRQNAYMPGKVFDIGATTSQALRRIEQGIPAHESGLAGEGDNGNGSLMRILPVALVNREQPVHVVVERAMAASAVTHAHPRAQVTCAVYCLVARRLLRGDHPAAALTGAFSEVAAVLGPAHRTELDLLEHFPGRSGSGYVLDSFWSAWDAFSRSESYAETITRAIRYGNDTDTTAAIAGGLAGIYWGLGGIPKEWLAGMRGKEIVEPLVERLCATVSSVNEGASANLGKIPEAFEDYFKAPKVRFPVAPAESGGVIQESGWYIRYFLGVEGARRFMELYGINRRTSDRHLRIHDDGAIDVLPVVSEGFNFNPDTPGDRERAKREQEAKDASLIAELKSKGLW